MFKSIIRGRILKVVQWRKIIVLGFDKFNILYIEWIL